MTKTLSMVSHKNNYNLNANEGFVIFLTSKLVTWFIGSFTLKMKSQSIAYLLNGSEHMYWIWNLEDEVHSIWDLWVIKRPSRMQEQWFFQNRTDGKKTVFNRILKILIFWTDGCPCPNLRPKKIWGGGDLSSSQNYFLPSLSFGPKNLGKNEGKEKFGNSEFGALNLEGKEHGKWIPQFLHLWPRWWPRCHSTQTNPQESLVCIPYRLLELV